jgi:hypothetical protein
LRVLNDTNAPTIVSAFETLTNTIVITYSEPVTSASATTLANYTVTNSAGQTQTLSSILFNGDREVVLRFTSLPLAPYWASVRNVTDTSVLANPIAPNTTVKVGFAAQIVTMDGTFWRYDQSQQDFGTAWRAPAYDDSGWTGTGQALFDGKSGSPRFLQEPIRTTLTLNGAGGNAIPTYYFRTHFTALGATNGTLTFRTILDDGAIVYVNGVEVWRRRMPTGNVTYSQYANASVGDARYEGPFIVPVTNLVSGDNVLAVEVHNQSATSSDITWGGEFSVSVPYTIVPGSSVVQCPIVPAGLTNMPRLSISRANTTNIVIAWQNPVTNTCGSNAIFTLQRTMNLSNPPGTIQWSNVTTVSPVTITNAVTNKFFFRLAR